MSESHIHDLQAIIDDLDAMGRLIRVKGQVHLRYDLAGIAAKYEGGPRAVLFERVHGRDYPVFTGLYWSREMLGAVMRKDEAELPQYVSDCIKAWQAKPKHPKVVKKGPVLEVTEDEVDLDKLPIPIHAIKDGGPYFDAAVVIAKDPETGIRNASIQRFMVVDADRMNINIDAGRHLETYLEKAARMGKTLPITLNIGCGPGLHFAASTPAEAAPIDTDELGIASAFHGKPLQLVPGTVSDVEMVAHAMWALECEIIPGEVDNEGPFAEVTGYYAHVDKRPVVHVRKVHRREKPVFQTILSGIEVWNSVGLLGEANVLATLQKQVPGVRDVYFTHGGGGFYHAVVQIDQKMPGWTKQAIMATFAAFPPLKMVTVVDCDVDIRSPMDVEWAMTERLDAATDIHVIENVFGHGLNPTFPGYLGAKVGFDATRPFPYTPDWDRSTYKSVDLSEWRIEVPELRAPSEPVVEAPAAPAPQPAAGNGQDASSGQTFGPNGPEGGKKKKKKKKSKGRRGNGLPDLSGVSGGELEAQVAAVLADWLSRSEERK
jgi:2,5-furandicarboxylate decarboxylase 1